MSNLTIHNETNAAERGGGVTYDHLYIFGAEIVDPENNRNAVRDYSTSPISAAYLVAVESSEDENAYLAALSGIGVVVTGTNDDGDWIGYQTRPLAL